jgi:regulatory protein
MSRRSRRFKRWAEKQKPPRGGQPEVDRITDHAQETLAAAYRYLNRRERTQAEMRAHLARAGATPEDVERAVATLVEQGFLDDRRFVRLFVQDKRELEEWGSDRIRRALLARGADADLIEDALTEPRPDGEAGGGTDGETGRVGADGEMERALALLRRRFPSPAGDRRERDRALGVLLRKGYDTDLALEAIAAHTRESARADYY